jgi:chromosome segregation ATPase
MSRKKGEVLAERAANLAIRYAQLEQRVHKLLAERDGLAGDLRSLEKHYEQTMENAKSLRLQLEDMRKQRDRAVNSAENAESRQIEVQRNLDRCLGWIDAKEGKPPLLEVRPELPF